ncbi:alpha/beta hydrolase fold protein [Hyaloraphidium curvatum]|nr:alpha/beta hydrolase fold protein [Hyaloraphidium curvatum]
MPDVTLRSGRIVSYRDDGDPAGAVVLHAHGGLFSSAYAELAGPTALALRVRLITPDRPGINRSSPQPGRTLKDWADDAVELLDILGVKGPVGVLGWSMGGQYALALAAFHPERVSSGVVVAGAVPLDDPAARATLNHMDAKYTHLAEDQPKKLASNFSGMKVAVQLFPNITAKYIGKAMGPEDKAVIAGLPNKDPIVHSFAEAVKQTDGLVEEYRAWALPWGFNYGDVKPPFTVIWGKADHLIPQQWAEEYAKGLGTELRIVDGGHAWFLADWEPVLRQFAWKQ